MQVELLLLIMGFLFFLSIATDKVGNRFGIPAMLLFLMVGIIFSTEWFGLGDMDSDSAEAIGSIALCIILFSGGMDTRISDIKPVIAQGITLATFGVGVTCLITGICIWLGLGKLAGDESITLPMALLIAATMSSTDSASVFSILRTQGIGLKHNLRPLLELESGANDPMAYILTTTLIGIVINVNPNINALIVIQDIFIQIVVGVAVGFLAGRALVKSMRKIALNNESLYPIMVLAGCIFTFGVAHFLKGNSFLAVYIAGVIIGNSKFIRKRQTRSFFDGLTWLSQLVMFLMLGLIFNPKAFLDAQVWIPCLIITAVMMFVARPVAVFLCLWPFDEFDRHDKLFTSWVGLKGATPIIFAILCEARGVQSADLIFNVVFLCTLISLLIQGTTLTSFARFFNLATAPIQLRKLSHFDIDLPEEIESSTTELEVTADMLDETQELRNLPLPPQTLVIMVRRDESFFVPRGATKLKEGDQLLIITDDNAALAQQYMQEEQKFTDNDWRMQLITNTHDFIKNKTKSFMQGNKEKI